MLFLKSIATIKPWIFSLSVNSKISSIALTASNIDVLLHMHFDYNVLYRVSPLEVSLQLLLIRSLCLNL